MCSKVSDPTPLTAKLVSNDETANFGLDPVAYFFQAKSPADESKRCDTDKAKELEVERSPPSKDKRSLYRKTKGVDDSDVIPSTPILLDTKGMATYSFFPVSFLYYGLGLHLWA